MFKFELEITPRQVADLMVTVIESGESRCWCNGVYWQSREDEPPDTPGVWYDDEGIYGRKDFKLEVHHIEDESTPFDEENDEGIIKLYLTRDGLAKGFEALAKDNPRILGNILGGDYDAVDADAWFQCCVLGKTVYG